MLSRFRFMDYTWKKTNKKAAQTWRDHQQSDSRVAFAVLSSSLCLVCFRPQTCHKLPTMNFISPSESSRENWLKNIVEDTFLCCLFFKDSLTKGIMFGLGPHKANKRIHGVSLFDVFIAFAINSAVKLALHDVCGLLSRRRS